MKNTYSDAQCTPMNSTNRETLFLVASGSSFSDGTLNVDLKVNLASPTIYSKVKIESPKPDVLKLRVGVANGTYDGSSAEKRHQSFGTEEFSFKLSVN